MSLHRAPQSPALVTALRNHGLATHTPSQLSDAFRLGWAARFGEPPDATDLTRRLRQRASEDREIRANNEAVAVALRGHALLVADRKPGDAPLGNSYAARLASEHASCARKDAALAQDWDAAADTIEAQGAHAAQIAEELRQAREELQRAKETLAQVGTFTNAFRTSDRDVTVWDTERWRDLRRLLFPEIKPAE